MLAGSSALGGSAFSTRVLAAAPPPSAITPQLIEAARKEGKVVWYTSVDLPVAEKIARTFEAKYPGVAVRVERTGAERVFQRIGQEYASSIHAVDVVNSSDAAHFIVWKRDGWLAPYVPEDVAKFYPAEHKDADGMFASFRVWVSMHRLQHHAGESRRRAEELCRSARSEMGRQNGQGASRLQRHHHDRDLSRCSAISAGTTSRNWRSSASCRCSPPPIRRKSLALGERAVMVDGNEYNIFQIMKEQGQPVEPVYPTEGAPLIIGPNGLFKNAPNPNAARLFQKLLLHASKPSSTSSTSADCARCIPAPRKSRAASRSRISRP